MTTYHITRFRQDGENEILVRGLTLEQAQAHCQREDTRGEGWFDGYAEDAQAEVVAFDDPEAEEALEEQRREELDELKYEAYREQQLEAEYQANPERFITTKEEG